MSCEGGNETYLLWHSVWYSQEV